MRLIPLSRGAIAVVDDCDYERIAAHKWSLLSNGYAHRAQMIDGRQRAVLMHRVIADAAPGQYVDHADGDRLNNTRANLRLCSCSQNMANAGVRAHKASSRFKGVYPKKNGRPWRAMIKVNYRNIHLGPFDTEEDAARAYDAAALRHFGEFARLNFPLDRSDAA